jgi:hypoxanthine phosphoribosyltransferase
MSQSIVPAVLEPPQQHMSWGDLDWLIVIAIKQMREKGYHPDRIIPIGGGGLIPAGIMSYRLYKRDHIPIHVMPPVYAKSYGHDKKRGALSVLWPDGIEAYDSETTLIVDDICDSGATVRAIKERMPKSNMFCVVSKQEGLCEWAGTLTTKPDWWHFPWERS